MYYLYTNVLKCIYFFSEHISANDIENISVHFMTKSFTWRLLSNFLFGSNISHNIPGLLLVIYCTSSAPGVH